jgi:predicted  nucleic acid-binding Zn-ribbon protein
MTERGPTTKSIEEDLVEIAQEVEDLTRGMADLRLDFTRSLAELRNEFTEFRSGIEKELKIIRWIGVFFAGVLTAVVIGSGHVVWDAATITAEVKQLREEMRELKSDFKEMAKQLDTIARQTAPKAGG